MNIWSPMEKPIIARNNIMRIAAKANIILAIICFFFCFAFHPQFIIIIHNEKADYIMKVIAMKYTVDKNK